MDTELHVLRDMRADAPAPSTQELEHARARLLAAVDRPRPRLAGLPRHVRLGPPPRLARPPRLGRRVAMVGGLTVLLTAGLTVAQHLEVGDGGPALAPVANAADLLQRAAMAAQAEPDPRPDQFYYVKTVSKQTSPDFRGSVRRSRVTTSCHEAWSPANRSPRLLVVTEGPPPGRGCAVGLPVASNRPGDWLRFYPDPATLPTQPGALRTRLYREADRGCRVWNRMPGCSRDDLVFEFVARMLRDPVPAKLRAALYEVTATIPGVTLVDDAVDAAGRHGLAVERRADGFLTRQIILDRTSYRFLGERDVVVRAQGDWRIGDIVDWTAQVRTAVVDRAGERP